MHRSAAWLSRLQRACTRSVHVSSVKLGMPSSHYSRVLASILGDTLSLPSSPSSLPTSTSSAGSAGEASTFFLPLCRSATGKAVAITVGAASVTSSVWKRVLMSIVGQPNPAVTLEQIQLGGVDKRRGVVEEGEEVLAIATTSADAQQEGHADVRVGSNPFGIEHVKEIVLSATDESIDDISEDLSSYLLPSPSIPNVWLSSDEQPISVRLVLAEKEGVRSIVLKVEDWRKAMMVGRQAGLQMARVGDDAAILLPSLKGGPPILFDIRLSQSDKVECFYAEPQEVDSGGEVEARMNAEMARRSVSCRGAVSIGAAQMVKERVKNAL